jgi:two-component system chemotaxis sensor kinase CheA
MSTIELNHREALADFVDEALESLHGLPAQLEAYRLAPADAEPINAVFRAVHSLKGCAAFLDLHAIRAFAHGLENTLDAVRTGATPLGEDLERRLVEGLDHLDTMLQDAAAGNIGTELHPEETQLLEAVQAAARKGAATHGPANALFQDLLHLADHIATAPGDGHKWSQRLRELVSEHASGAAEALPPAAAAVPAPTPTPADFAAAQFFCGDVDVTDRVAALLQFFSGFAEGHNCEQAEEEFASNVKVFGTWAREAGHAELEEALQAAAVDFRTVHESPLDFDENLVSLIWDHLWPAFDRLRVRASHDEPAPVASVKAAAKPADPECAKSRFVRVKEEHLDTFLERVSRLFITTERFRDVQTRMADTGELTSLVEELRQINMDLKVESTALQHGVMTLRRVSVAGLFSKFPRMARTLAGQLGKQINVHVAGEDTEVDKVLAEDLDAPLTHLVRNVVDHGIESSDERRSQGKSESGNLYIEARQTRKLVVLTVRDDGRGMAPRRLRAKAVEKGVVSQAEAEAMSDHDAMQLIFRPGFSTAERVTEVSGRGVGMDVVRTTVEQHQGQVHVESTPGQGTTIRLELPRRQATLVLDGLMVAEGDAHFVIPFENIKEIAEVEANHFTSVHGRPVVTIRDSSYRSVYLDEVLGFPRTERPVRDCEMAVVVQSKQGPLCLRTDQVIGHRQVVVSDVKETLPDSTRILGIAQLGGGRLAPVLNVPEIVASLL